MRSGLGWLSVLGIAAAVGCGDDAADDSSCFAPTCIEDAGEAVDAASDGSADPPDTGVALDAGPCTTCDGRIVSAEWVAARLADSAVQIVDVRAASAYTAGHVPGALHVELDALTTTLDGVPGQVADAATVQAALAGAGLNDSTTVVVYGNASEPSPARVVWTLEHYGHTDVRLLDGGWGRWEATQPSAEAGASSAPTGDWVAGTPVDALRVDKAWVLAHLDDSQVVLVDARSMGEYDGGHIPGALSVDWTRNVTGGVMRPQPEVRALYAGVADDATVVAYCQTGVRGSLVYLVLRWLGWSDVRVYDGSWAEWGADPTTPKE